MSGLIGFLQQPTSTASAPLADGTNPPPGRTFLPLLTASTNNAIVPQPAQQTPTASLGEQSPTSSAPPSSNLSAGWIALLTLGITFAFVLILFLIFICVVRVRNRKRAAKRDSLGESLLPLGSTSYESSMIPLSESQTANSTMSKSVSSFVIKPKTGTLPKTPPVPSSKGNAFVNLVEQAVAVAKRDTVGSNANRLFGGPVSVEVDKLSELVSSAVTASSGVGSVALADTPYAVIGGDEITSSSGSGTSEVIAVENGSATSTTTTTTITKTKTIKTTMKNGVAVSVTEDVDSNTASAISNKNLAGSSVVDIPVHLIAKSRLNPQIEVAAFQAKALPATGPTRTANGKSWIDNDHNRIIPVLAPVTALTDSTSPEETRMSSYTLPTTTTQHAQLESSLRANLPSVSEIPLDYASLESPFSQSRIVTSNPLRNPGSENTQLAQHNLQSFDTVKRYEDECMLHAGDLVRVVKFTGDAWCYVEVFGAVPLQVAGAIKVVAADNASGMRSGFVPLFVVESVGLDTNLGGDDHPDKLKRYWSLRQQSVHEDEPVV
ncbi:hypothetical protein BJ741DRAFT_632430 [Chytriomyces cf. hyalinus JEL632]|nr:hypothetical protein BJ741DRAFT_632430 [Chytriomyces cf. hyalinus JEL632]